MEKQLTGFCISKTQNSFIKGNIRNNPKTKNFTRNFPNSKNKQTKNVGTLKDISKTSKTNSDINLLIDNKVPLDTGTKIVHKIWKTVETTRRGRSFKI